VTSETDATERGTGLIEALHVTGPAAGHSDKLMLFGRFVGSWCLEWTGPDTGGQPATMTGELHVGWVLGGRAVQDIWIVPGRGEPGEGQPPLAFHGSTIRFYDSAIDAWRSTWIEPVNGRVRRFTGRADGSGIVLLSDEDDPQLRWRFTDITADSFTWRAESSRDAGASWNVDEQMLATRDNSARARTLPKPQCLPNASEQGTGGWSRWSGWIAFGPQPRQKCAVKLSCLRACISAEAGRRNYRGPGTITSTHQSVEYSDSYRQGSRLAGYAKRP
jgi:hypothetical protein